MNTLEEINKGFKINVPDVLVPWGINELKLKDIFKGHELKHVSEKHYVAECESLKNLKCLIAFHFSKSEKLNRLEFFSEGDLRENYDYFQKNIESCFGLPSIQDMGEDGFLLSSWNATGGILISHGVYERFGLVHYLDIQNKRIWNSK